WPDVRLWPLPRLLPPPSPPPGPFMNPSIPLAGVCTFPGFLLPAPLSRAAEPAKEEPVSFHRQLRPILQQKCAGCHQPAKKRAGLLLLSYGDAKKGGDGGTLWVVGKPEESLLIKSLKGTGEQKQMPEGEPPLPAEQIE